MKVKSLKKRGFTLVEALLAAAVLGIAGYILAVTFNNAQSALIGWEYRGQVDKVKYWVVDTIPFNSLTLDQLEQGDELTSAEGYRVEWIATAEPTRILDQFEVAIFIEIYDRAELIGEFEVHRITNNTEWYEGNERDQLLEFKEELFEQRERGRLFR